MKVWTYVITCDDGGAPNFEPAGDYFGSLQATHSKRCS